MIKKRLGLPLDRSIPLLETVRTEKINFDFIQGKKIRKWYGVYIVTVVLALIVGVALIISEIGLGWIDFSTVDIKSDTPNPPAKSEGVGGLLLPSYQNQFDKPQNDLQNSPQPPSKQPLSKETLYEFDYTKVPEGEIPILPMDLSLTSYGTSYIQNDTGLSPDTDALLRRDWHESASLEYLSSNNAPKVLIVHTHGTEAYSPDGAISYVEAEGELARSDNVQENVVAIGSLIKESLSALGIESVHCTVMHDQPQYKDSYARAESTIREYLKKYPSIRLVIDVHRDSIIKSSGELVRPVSLINGEAAAQLMCIVGSDWGGETNEKWEGNLALAIQIRERLNVKYENLCRPVYLRSSTYNQEIAPYSLLIEVGAAGNSLPEAKRTAKAFSEILSDFIPKL